MRKMFMKKMEFRTSLANLFGTKTPTESPLISSDSQKSMAFRKQYTVNPVKDFENSCLILIEK